MSAPGVTRFAVLSHTLPGSPWGQGIVLQRVLGGFSADDYCLLSRQDHRSVADAALRLASGDGASARPAHAYAVGESWRQLASGPGLIRAVARMAGVALRVQLRASKIRRALRRERPGVLVVCSGDLVDLPAGFLAARATGIPLLAYVFDDYANQHYRRAERAVAGVFERLVLRRARAIVVPNEFMAEVYAARYAVTPRIVRNAIDDVHLAVEPQTAWPQAADNVRIVYTGSVYQAQADSLVTLTRALGLWARPNRTGSRLLRRD